MLSIVELTKSSNANIKYMNKNRNNKMTAITFAGELKNLKPQRVWQLFEEMTQIYRESGPSATNRENNKEISNYLVDKLNALGFEVEQVKEGSGKYNIFATRNVDKSKNNAIILQGHMDMLCISDDKNPKKPIKLNVENDILRANNRTLGADNGIGLALALAIAEEHKFKDLPLQIVFTVDEETGMYGAAAMKPEDLKGHYLINIDSEKIGEITIGCAGMDTFKEVDDVRMIPVGDTNHRKITFLVKNASGGHSGEDINKGRLNPIREVLTELNSIPDIKLISVMGGEKPNSIPREVTVEILVPNTKINDVKKQLTEKYNLAKTKHAKTDPDLEFTIKSDPENAASTTKIVNQDFQEKLLRILGDELHVGFKSAYDNGDTKTSQNLGIVNLKDGKIELAVSMRSSDQHEKKEMYNKTVTQLSELFGKEIKPFNSSPIWEPKLKSPLTELAALAYKELGVTNPRVYTCHGGLENAQFAKLKPDIDQISIGPDIYDPHTVKERIKISSVDTIYKFIENLLQKLKQVNK
ncbi:MAG: beta-Ala-His dipeptidase [Cyanobacteriota bacterium]